MNTIDPRLVALYNEYLKEGKEEEFIEMIYALLDTVDPITRKKVYQHRAAQKRKENTPVRKIQKEKLEQFFEGMSPEELIAFQNTPWSEIPDWIKEAMPKLVQNPERCKYVRIYGLVNDKQRQREIAASRITRYMESKGFITSFEGKTTLHYENFSKVCNEIAEKYDLKWRPGQRGQRTRITPRDLKNYTQARVTPKGDKMAILTIATGLPLWYLSGYMNDNPKKAYCDEPLSKYRFRKPPKSGDEAA